ncbi:hypothetical protein GXD46_08865 [Listeria monocytogenes]|nr:hypothetical protein [Listeria monocytogenes]
MNREEMRVVFNYRKIFREEKVIREYAEGKSLPFPIPLMLALNFVGALIISALFSQLLQLFGLADWWLVPCIFISLMYAFLVAKIKPDGKNLYVYLFDYIRFYYRYKIKRIKIANDKAIKQAEIVIFTNTERVSTTYGGKIKDSSQGNQRQFTTNKQGRRVGVL